MGPYTRESMSRRKYLALEALEPVVAAREAGGVCWSGKRVMMDATMVRQQQQQQLSPVRNHYPPPEK